MLDDWWQPEEANKIRFWLSYSSAWIMSNGCNHRTDCICLSCLEKFHHSPSIVDHRSCGQNGYAMNKLMINPTMREQKIEVSFGILRNYCNHSTSRFVWYFVRSDRNRPRQKNVEAVELHNDFSESVLFILSTWKLWIQNIVYLRHIFKSSVLNEKATLKYSSNKPIKVVTILLFVDDSFCQTLWQLLSVIECCWLLNSPCTN